MVPSLCAARGAGARETFDLQAPLCASVCDFSPPHDTVILCHMHILRQK